MVIVTMSSKCSIYLYQNKADLRKGKIWTEICMNLYTK